jgi:hypothetical protein
MACQYLSLFSYPPGDTRIRQREELVSRHAALCQQKNPFAENPAESATTNCATDIAFMYPLHRTKARDKWKFSGAGRAGWTIE